YWDRPWYGNRPAWYWSRPWYGYHTGWHYGYWNFWRSPPALWFGAGLAAGWLLSPGETFVYSNPYYVPASTFVAIDYSQPLPAPPVELESAAFPADPDLDNDGIPDVRPTADLPATAADPVAVAANRRLDEARAAFRDGRYPRAQELIESAIRDLPSDTTMHEVLALTLFAQGRYQDAAAALYAVLSAGPGWDWATMRGLYPATDTYTAQLRALEAFVGANPQAGHGHFLLAYHYLVVGDQTSAIGQLREVTRVQPADQLAAALLQSLTEAAANPPPAPGRGR
ncbi:MAG TPA: tetratricopeptide repeat protein, partial [Gemmataceae bacterium]|nr:tetratricopeptide repeat protein [Gemmataceae bacterium]